jgi:hypothetical protein
MLLELFENLPMPPQVVLLVVVLGRVEVGERQHFGVDGFPQFRG